MGFTHVQKKKALTVRVEALGMMFDFLPHHYCMKKAQEQLRARHQKENIYKDFDSILNYYIAYGIKEIAAISRSLLVGSMLLLNTFSDQGNDSTKTKKQSIMTA